MARIDTVGIQSIEAAALSGSPDVFFELGLLYSSGNDREPDLVAAHKWFNLAAMNGNGAAREHRREIAVEMSDADIAAAQRQAREWLQTH